MKTWYDEQRELRETLESQAAEARNKRLAEAEQNKRGAFALRTKTMDERLRALFDSMPEEEKPKRRHMDFFKAALAAKWRTRTGRNEASVAELGPALTRVGWKRKREWLGAEQTFKTWWYPPNPPCE
jgi:hypothetical protein